MKIYNNEIIDKMNFLYNSGIKENIGFYIFGIKKDNDIIFNKCSSISYSDKLIHSLIYNLEGVDVINYIYINSCNWKDQVFYEYINKRHNIDFQNININDIMSADKTKNRR